MKTENQVKLEKIVDNTRKKETGTESLRATENNSGYNMEFICWKNYKNDSAYACFYADMGILGGGVQKQNWRRIANVIITNLGFADVGESLNYLRGKKHFKKGTYYDYEGFTYGPFKRVVDLLADAGYMTYTIGDYDKKIGKVYSTMSPTQKFKDKVATIIINQKDINFRPPMPVMLKEKKVIEEYLDKNGKKQEKIVNGEFKELKADAKHTKTKIRLMSRYYDEIMKHDFSWNAPKEMREQIKNKKGTTLPDLNNIYPVCTFTGNMSNGGRMYRAFWISCPKDARQYIKMDGEYLVDIDWAACHIALLYDKIGSEIPQNPYGITKEGFYRDIAKKLMLTLINIEPKNRHTASEKQLRAKVMLAIRKDIIKIARKYGYYHPEYHKLFRRQAIELIELLQEAHYEIADMFFSGIGLELQFRESENMREVMKMALTKGVVVLPCHDGCLVKESDFPVVKEIFEEFKEKKGFNYSVNFFNPKYAEGDQEAA